MADQSSTNDLEDFLEFSNSELQFYLQQRGLSTTGTHGSLAARALIAHENSVEIKSTALDIAKKLKSDYDTLLKKHDLITDPFAMAQNMFTDDITKFPKVNIGQIFSYILRMKAFEAEYIGQYKVRKAYSFFKSGMVDKIFVTRINNKTVLKSSVVPSQRINNDQHKLWILFDEKSDILCSFCSCTAGFGACCNHVVAAMYKVEFANEKGLTDPACTDVLCYWNSASKEIAPMKVKDMTYSSLCICFKSEKNLFLRKFVILFCEKKLLTVRAEGC